jgi:hypothetical protein
MKKSGLDPGNVRWELLDGWKKRTMTVAALYSIYMLRRKIHDHGKITSQSPGPEELWCHTYPGEMINLGEEKLSIMLSTRADEYFILKRPRVPARSLAFWVGNLSVGQSRKVDHRSAIVSAEVWPKSLKRASEQVHVSKRYVML